MPASLHGWLEFKFFTAWRPVGSLEQGAQAWDDRAQDLRLLPNTVSYGTLLAAAEASDQWRLFGIAKVEPPPRFWNVVSSHVPAFGLGGRAVADCVARLDCEVRFGTLLIHKMSIMRMAMDKMCR